MLGRMISELPTLAKSAELIADGDLSPLELVDACLERIDEFEPQVRAWVSIDREGARREARRLGDLLADGKEPLSPLHGIPIGVKDIIDVAGWPTGCGSPLRGHSPATRDAPAVAALRAAGAIILGKTVTTEFACFDPPPTRNPWNAAHTPGGSSSGSAAAVATEMCLAALGTQTGGSIVRPAAYCGVAGFKPPFGEVSLEGIEPISYHLDHVGPIARRVSDLYFVWQQLAVRAADGLDAAVTRPWAERNLDYWLDCYGVNRTLFVLEGEWLDQRCHETRVVFEQSLAGLRGQFDVRPLRLPPSFGDIHARHRAIMAVDAAAHHGAEYARVPEKFSKSIAGLIEAGMKTSAITYSEAVRLQRVQRRELVSLLQSQGDLLGCLVMPSAPAPAPADLTGTGDPLFNSPWSYLGLPALTLPCGLAPNGLPCGLQFISLTAPQVFAMAGLCERVLHDYPRPPCLED
jgi:Asp-tRNA(Asn)/Glu-tRNA(Gln) amidotransferase A subunit family amidase